MSIAHTVTDRIDPGTASDGIDPRVARSRAAILEATAALLIEGGFAGVTIERVAERSRVAKTTIYRHWKSRSRLIFDAFESLLRPVPVVLEPRSLREGLVQMLDALSRGVTQSAWAPAIASLVEAGDRDDEIRALVHDFLDERMEPVRGTLERAKATGTLGADLDVDVAISMLAGPIFYRRLVSRETLSPALSEAIVDRFLRGARPGTSSPFAP